MKKQNITKQVKNQHKQFRKERKRARGKRWEIA